MIFWIIPAVSLFVYGITYAGAFNVKLDFGIIMPMLLGLMFLLVGNYFPKIKQNHTLGIKITWTLQNEENWNQTHRFGGKVWVIGGLLLLLSGFLPVTVSTIVIICAIAAVSVLPIAYSYSLYRKHQKAGISYDAGPKSKAEKIVGRMIAIVIPITLIAAAVILFTGDIKVSCDDASLRIEADYWPDLEVDYSQIDTIQYRDDFSRGTRTNGFGSARLSMGLFQNEEFGSYTLYAYTRAKEFIVLTSGEKKLVLGMKDASETQAIYDAISAKIDSKVSR